MGTVVAVRIYVVSKGKGGKKSHPRRTPISCITLGCQNIVGGIDMPTSACSLIILWRIKKYLRLA